MKRPDSEPMTCREAGKRGGAAVREKYGREHYVEMGRKGGEATKAAHPEQYARIGKLGGRKGGNATRERHGDEHYREIGLKGAAKVKALIDAGKALIEASKAALEEQQ